MNRLLHIAILVLTLLIPNSRDQLGDVNNDGIINVQDIIRVLNIILEYEPEPTEYELWAGDVNVDDQIGIQDIIIIIDQILHTYDCPDWYRPCADDLSQCCQDTTEQFTSIVIDTIGIYPSTLLDVSIVSENEIYAVHRISTDNTTYNTAKWNGDEWELLNIYGPSEVWSIFTFSTDDIWAGVNRPLHFNGNEWIGFLPEDGWEDDWNFEGVISCIWGSSSDDIYFIGNNGSIAHYDGETFEFTPWDTDIELVDIHGTPDGEHVFIAGWEWDWPGSSLVLELQNGKWHQIYYSEFALPSEGNYGIVSAVAVFGDTLYASTYSGILKYNYIDGTTSLAPSTSYEEYQGVFRDLVVQSPIDILIFPGIPSYVHFNGSTWDVNDDVIQYFGEGAAWTLGGEMKGDMFVSVGYCCGASQAVIVRGFR